MKRWAVLAAVAAIAGSSATPAEPVSKTVGGNGSHSPAQQQAQTDSRPGPSAPAHAPASPPVKSTQAASEGEHSPHLGQDQSAKGGGNGDGFWNGKLTDWAIVVLTGGLLAVGAAQAEIYRRQAVIMRRSLLETRRSNHLAKQSAAAARDALDRPWLYVNDVRNVATSDLIGHEMRYAVVTVTNYGKAPAAVFVCQGLLFYSLGPRSSGESLPFTLPSTMREFLAPEEIRQLPFKKGMPAQEETGARKTIAQPLGQLRLAPLSNGLVIAPDKSREFIFAADTVIEKAVAGAPLRVERLAQLYLIGSMTSQSPDGEMETVRFCYGARGDEPYLAVMGPPYNQRERHVPKSVGPFGPIPEGDGD
jgi:hypothetical protein